MAVERNTVRNSLQWDPSSILQLNFSIAGNSRIKNALLEFETSCMLAQELDCPYLYLCSNALSHMCCSLSD